MPRITARRWIKRFLIGVTVVFLLPVSSLFVAYQFYGWRRLDTLPTPKNILIESAFRPYQEHGDVPGARERPYVIEIESKRGALLFYGSGHTGDPDDPQIDQIVNLWNEFRPTIGLCESRLGLYIGGLRAGVTMFSEVGTPYALGRTHDIPVYSLEPAWEDEIAVMLREFDPRETAAFYFLRVYVSERGRIDEDDIQTDDVFNRHAEPLLHKRLSRAGLQGAFASLDDFDAWWNEALAEQLGDWRRIPEEAMWPGRSSPTLLTRLANTSNLARDEHMTKLLIDLVRRGDRVFVVCGASHAITIEPVLRTALQE